MQAYREGATGMNVLQKTKAIKKSHRVPLLLEQQPREAYSRNRGQRVAQFLSGREREEDEGARGGRLREGESEIIFDQGEFARLTSQYLTTCGGGKAWGLAEIGKVMRNKVGTETPKMDYLVGQLFFEEFVEDQRLVEDGMREARERFEFGLFGDAAAVSFGNVQIEQYEKGD